MFLVNMVEVSQLGMIYLVLFKTLGVLLSQECIDLLVDRLLNSKYFVQCVIWHLRQSLGLQSKDFFVRHQGLILSREQRFASVRGSFCFRDLRIFSHLSVDLVDFKAIVNFFKLVHYLVILGEVLVVVVGHFALLLLQELVCGRLESVGNTLIRRAEDVADKFKMLWLRVRH